MGPLRGWELPPWSQAPKADALSQALYLLLLGSLPWALATAPCKEEEYPVGSECCPKCSPGTEQRDTMCEDCPPGTFSPNGTLEQCQPWTMCSGPFQREAHAGTSSSDVTCSSWGPPLMSSFLGIFVLLVLISLCFWMKRRRQHERSTKPRTFQQVPQAPPDVTTVAMEETASMPPAGV